MEETNYDQNEVAETTSEETAPEEVTEEETSEETEDSTTEESEDDGIDWKERALKAERTIEKNKSKVKKEPKAQTPSSDEVTLSRLEVRGVMEPADQEYVLRFAKAEGVSPIEALSDPIVKDRLEANKRTRESAKATPRSNNRTNNQVDEVAAAVRRYHQTGELPDNLALASKVGDALKNGA